MVGTVMGLHQSCYCSLRPGQGATLVGRLYEAMASAQGDDVKEDIFSELVMYTKVQKGQMVPSVSLSSFLEDWLTEHICRQDKQYGRFIAAPVG